jgi:SAM-dependent methyltransferase
VGYKNPSRYIARANFVFDKLDLKGKRILEVGCGKGGLLAWAGLLGAEYVLGLEPEEDGVLDGSYATLEKVVSTLVLDTVEISRSTFDDYSFSRPFDIVILYDVINHLNEYAVMDLHLNPDSYNIYLRIAERIRSVTALKGILILADSARSNIWGDLGYRSPFSTSLEWKKHQNPIVWQGLFKEAGFKLLDLRWSSLYPLGKWSSNALLQYVTLSHFVMRLIKDDEHTIGNR